MTPPGIDRSRAAAAIAMAALLALPLASGASYRPDHLHVNVADRGNTVDAWWSQDPGDVVTDGCCARLEGVGWLEYRYALRGPDGIDIDWVDFAFDMRNDNVGSCRIQVFRGTSSSPLFDTGNRGCWSNHNYEEFRLYDVASDTYRFRVSCNSHACWHNVEMVYVQAWYHRLYLDVPRSFPSHDISEERLPLAPPGQCVEIWAEGSRSHDTVVQVDWGDGAVQSFTLDSSWHRGKAVCHTYLLPSTIPYQVCAQIVERDGLERSTDAVCRDVPGIWTPGL